MLLRNFINKLGIRDMSNNKLKTTGATEITANYGTLATYDCNKYTTTTGSQTQQTKIGLALGSGTTAPTINDYKLESPVTTLTSIGCTASCLQAGVYTTEHLLTLTQTVKNNTSNDITISELGIFTIYGGNYNCVLYTRDVITPVTLASGESKTFILSVDFEQLSTSVQS